MSKLRDYVPWCVTKLYMMQLVTKRRIKFNAFHQILFHFSVFLWWHEAMDHAWPHFRNVVNVGNFLIRIIISQWICHEPVNLFKAGSYFQSRATEAYRLKQELDNAREREKDARGRLMEITQQSVLHDKVFYITVLVTPASILCGPFSILVR